MRFVDGAESDIPVSRHSDHRSGVITGHSGVTLALPCRRGNHRPQRRGGHLTSLWAPQGCSKTEIIGARLRRSLFSLSTKREDFNMARIGRHSRKRARFFLSPALQMAASCVVMICNLYSQQQDNIRRRAMQNHHYLPFLSGYIYVFKHGAKFPICYFVIFSPTPPGFIALPYQ